ncbi:MAG: alpha-amylase, partial [Verrucomicrobiaceae bacterium]
EPLVELLGTFAARAWQLGVRTGQMHLALASHSADTAFTPEPLTLEDQRALADEIRSSGQRAWGLLSAPSSKSVLTSEQLADFQPLEAVILQRVEALASQPVSAEKTRTHGDYHLGQVLNTGDDFVIIDFEGEPLRPLVERKAKRSPLRDVAGMLRSFHYAAHSGLGQAQDASELLPWAEAWALVTSRLFLDGWRETTAGAGFVPKSSDELRLLLDAYLLEKALYEVAYELNNRPTWVGIPLRGIASVLRE